MSECPTCGHDPYRGKQDTSIAASLFIAPRAHTLRADVLALLCAAPEGLSDEQIQHALDMAPNTERPRRKELVDGGFVRDSDRRITNDNGLVVIVWEATLKGHVEHQ